MARIQTYQQFFPYYLAQHSHPQNRALHYAGTTLAVSCALLGALSSPWWLLAVPVAGYGPAWVGHFRIERNRPATFTYPLWSLLGDFHMLALFLTGRLQARLPASST